MCHIICDVVNYCAEAVPLLPENFGVYDQIVIENLTREKDGYQTNFYMNFHLKDNLRI